jgi:hypothetical protein
MTFFSHSPKYENNSSNKTANKHTKCWIHNIILFYINNQSIMTYTNLYLLLRKMTINSLTSLFFFYRVWS